MAEDHQRTGREHPDSSDPDAPGISDPNLQPWAHERPDHRQLNLDASFEDDEFCRAESRIRSSKRMLVELLEELVAIRSENPPGENYLECALLLSERLRDMGFQPRLIEVPPHELRRIGLPTNRPRPSVLTSFGDESPEAPTLHFHAHYDVVPADGDALFGLRVEGDDALGRGTADMKGGIVSLFLALSALKLLRPRLRGRVLLSLVPDEETGGAAGTEYLFRAGVLPRRSLGMLTPEPTSGRIWHGNRGAISQLLTVSGEMAHVAVQHQGRNAFEGMLELGQMLTDLKQTVESRRFDGPDLGIEGPPSVLLLGGVTRGGTNFNVVPEMVSFSVDRRFHPDENQQEVARELDRLYRRFRRSGWDLDVRSLQKGAASFTPSDTSLAASLGHMVRAVTGESPGFGLCPGILETRFFLENDTPALAYGPGELAVSHTQHERVNITRIMDVACIYARMAWALLGDHPPRG
mgnify:CR=1 FL=1